MSAEAAADLAALLELLFLRVFEAAVAALLEVTLLDVLLWGRVEPAADFSDLLAVLLLNIFDDAEAAFGPVTFFLPSHPPLLT